MSEHDDWSTPSLYSGRSVVQPPMVTGADPMTGVLTADWDEQPHAHPQWSATTYVGPRRHRPRAGRPVVEAPAPTTAPPPSETAPEETPETSNRGLLAASRSMAVANLTSRITGFLRSSMLVAAIGLGQVGDAYNVANNFPNMVYELLLGGVLSSVLIPLLVHAQEEDDDDGVSYTQRLLSMATAALAAVTVIAVLCAPLITAPFVPIHAERSLATTFASLLLPEIFFYGLGAMFMAVLNIRHSYAPGAWSSVLNNVVMIVTLLVFWALPGPKTLTPSSMTTSQIAVLGVGTTLGIAAQALVLIPALRKTGFHWQWRFRARPHEAGRLREVGALGGWVFGYVVASQIGVTVIAYVGVHRHAFAIFTNADLLIQMPYGILVVSLLTALMPRLSRAAARGQTDSVIADLSLGARLSAIALVPITAGLIVLGPVLCVVLFAHGITSVEGARLMGTALAASAFGLFPFAVVMLQLRVFYAMRDGRTPTLINVFMVGTKVLIVLIGQHVVTGTAHIAETLTVATSASYVAGAIAGHVLLTRRLGRLGFGRVVRTVRSIGTASVVGGLVAYLILLGVDHALGRTFSGSLVALLGGSVGGLAALVAVAWRMQIPEVRDIAALARSR